MYLVLTVSENNSFENPENNSSFYLRPIEDLATNTYNPDRSLTLTKDGNLVQVSGTYKTIFAEDVIQEIKNNVYKHDWFQFQFLNTQEELSVMSFYNTKAEKSLAPKLIVKYLNNNN